MQLTHNPTRIAKYMRDELESRPQQYDRYGDHEICLTLLAEDTADEFSIYDRDGNIPEEVFELALEVSDEHDWFAVGGPGV